MKWLAINPYFEKSSFDLLPFVPIIQRFQDSLIDSTSQRLTGCPELLLKLGTLASSTDLSGEQMNPQSVLEYASDQQAKFVSIRFTDFPGTWQHLTFPIAELSENSFDAGFGFDASSIRGWAAIHESDMLLLPDPARFWMDPFAKEPTLCLIGNAIDPVTKGGYPFDPRAVAIRAESYLRATGLADVAYFGPEAEFFVFDSVKFHNEQSSAGYEINSNEGHWNTGRDRDETQKKNLGYHVRGKEGYVPCPPVDSLSDLRSAISLTLAICGIIVECHHHEVATAGQCEIDFRYSTLLTLGRQPTNLQIRSSQYRIAKGQSGDFHAETSIRR